MKINKPVLNLIILLVTLLLIFAALSLFESFPLLKSKQSKIIKEFGIVLPQGNFTHGIDVSKHQGTIDWKRVAEMRGQNKKIDFVFIKATEGITRTDQQFSKNWKGAANNNLIRGAYHFYYPSRDAKKQAQNFTKNVILKKGDLPPVIDIELSNGKTKKTIVKDLETMCNELEQHYGVQPIIYTNLHFYETFLKDNFKKYPLWISCYFSQNRFEKECGHDWIFWQHSEKGKVDGINGNVDFNVFNGSVASLKNLLVKK